MYAYPPPKYAIVATLKKIRKYLQRMEGSCVAQRGAAHAHVVEPDWRAGTGESNSEVGPKRVAQALRERRTRPTLRPQGNRRQ